MKATFLRCGVGGGRSVGGVFNAGVRDAEQKETRAGTAFLEMRRRELTLKGSRKMVGAAYSESSLVVEETSLCFVRSESRGHQIRPRH